MNFLLGIATTVPMALFAVYVLDASNAEALIYGLAVWNGISIQVIEEKLK